MAQYRAFTAVETMLTVGIIAVTAGFTVPMYRNYQIRSDLDLVTEQTIQGLRRAQVLAQSGENDSSWGFYVQDGVLYQGEAYAVRDPQSDETYPVPSTINTSGLPEVSFSRVDGIPDRTGEIIIQGLSGEQRIIIVGIDGVLSSSGIEGGEGVGEGMGSSGSSSGGGEEGEGSSSSAGGDDGGSSSGSSSGGGDGGGDDGGDDGGGSSGGGDSGEPTCEDRFTIGTDGVISTTGNVNATFEVLGSQITYGAGGPEIQVRVYASTNGGTTWVPLFNEADVDGGEEQTILNIPNGSQVLLKVNGRYSWLFNRTYISNDSEGHIEVLRDGETPPEYEAFDNQEDLAAFLGIIIGEDGTIDIGTYDAVFLAELGSLGGSSADFQDAVVKVTFSQPAGSCASSDEPRFKVSFGRVENVGNGDAQAKLFVGEQGMIFGPDEWVPLRDSGSMLLDNFLTEDVPGPAAWRHSGYVRVLQHGSHFDGSKEIVDATITFQNAVISSVENDTGQNITENPLDGIVNDGAGGDEVVVAADNLSLLYQTRVTLQDDAILIHWVESEGAGIDDDTDGDGGTGDTGDTEEDGDTGDTGDTGDDTGDTGESGGDTDSGGGDLDDSTPDPCGVAYTITENGQIEINEPADITFHALGSHVTYGARGPEVRAYISASLDGGMTWQSLFGFRDIDGGEWETFSGVGPGARLVLRTEGRYSWLFRSKADTADGTGRVKILRRGGAVPGTTPYTNIAGLVRIRKTSLLLLFELQELNAGSDYQDAAVEIILEKPASQGICGAANTGGGSGSSSSSAGGTGTDSSSSSSGDTGGGTGEDEEIMTICHYPPGNTSNPQTLEIPVSDWSAHQNHGDREGACESDTDGDTVPNSADLCPNTYMPESVPGQYMLFDRFALTADSPIFRHGPRKKIGQYTLSDTKGCSCEQLVDVAENKKTYHFPQFPRLHRQMRSLFPFYTTGARDFGCGKAIVDMVKAF
ncbi:MAG: hypothetical protein UY87_C0059G0005 [Candidatus Peribacteria bacterium GW2011_GWC2_54_8]|nr:MAG: hypothetical protein UY87_C0059G0005 [Candidatus Peribacteria bacterium GW2011_GWC2_54_8]